MRHSETTEMNNRCRRRGGFTLTELVVSGSLLLGVMAIVAPLTVRSGRLWQDTRHQQLARDELLNQLERLIRLDPNQRRQAMSHLVPAQHLLSAWPSATITAQTIADRHGTRIELSLHRHPPATQSLQSQKPITLVGWLDPMPSDQVEDSP